MVPPTTTPQFMVPLTLTSQFMVQWVCQWGWKGVGWCVSGVGKGLGGVLVGLERGWVVYQWGWKGVGWCVIGVGKRLGGVLVGLERVWVMCQWGWKGVGWCVSGGWVGVLLGMGEKLGGWEGVGQVSQVGLARRCHGCISGNQCCRKLVLTYQIWYFWVSQVRKCCISGTIL